MKTKTPTKDEIMEAAKGLTAHQMALRAALEMR